MKATVFFNTNVKVVKKRECLNQPQLLMLSSIMNDSVKLLNNAISTAEVL